MDDFFNDLSRNLFESIKRVAEINNLRADDYDYGKPYSEAYRAELLKQAGTLAKKSGMGYTYLPKSCYTSKAVLLTGYKSGE